MTPEMVVMRPEDGAKVIDWLPWMKMPLPKPLPPVAGVEFFAGPRLRPAPPPATVPAPSEAEPIVS